MSEIAHTSEPWRIESVRDWFNIVGADGSRAASDGSACGEYGPDMPMENARRIVACVNACRGIETDALEKTLSEGQTILTSIQPTYRALTIAQNDAIAANDRAHVAAVERSDALRERDEARAKLREAEQEIAYLNSRLNGGV